MSAWLIWIIIAAGLASAEALSLDLVLIMCAGGAGAGAIAAGAGAPVAGQLGVAIAVAIGLIAFVRPIARSHLTSTPATTTGTAALVGMHAIVLQTVNQHDGRIRLNGAEWSARSFDTTQTFDSGTEVRVMEIKGATALVWDGRA